MIPGELFVRPGEIELNSGRATLQLTVANTGDRPIQVGSHYHFFETNAALLAERRRARGLKLNYPEAVALISAAIMEGVPEMIPEIQVEATFPDGTKLVTVHNPIV